MRRLMTRASLAACVLLTMPAVARADITAFLGVSPTGSARLGTGVAAGAGLVVGVNLDVQDLFGVTAIDCYYHP